MKKTKVDTHKIPCQYFQAQDHFESAPGKNWQSNIYLNQEYGPGVWKEKIITFIYIICECMRENTMHHPSGIALNLINQHN